MRFIQALAAAVVLCSAGQAAVAQSYPNRPVRLVVPYTTGGGTDLMARIIGLELGKSLGQTVVVDNKAGAGGVIGTDIVAKAPPDGYTLGLISSAHAINPWLQAKLPFDPVTGITPITQIASGPNVVVVNAEVPAKSLAELIALVRKEPGRYSFGSAGVGNPTHLAGEIFQSVTHSKLIHVPYKGSGQAEVGLAGGEITLIIDSIPAALPFITSGKTRALAVTGKQRFPLLPEVPTAAEAGLADFELTTWWGVVAPPGTPAAIVSLLNDQIKAALQRPDTRNQFLKFGAETVSTTPAQFGQYIKAETARYGKLIGELNISTAP